jgi:hypothetical protein
MMAATNSSRAEPKPTWRHLLQAAKPHLHGRPAWLALAIMLSGAGLVLNWNWLVAAGMAPLLGALLPCTAMCALALCKKGGGSRDSKQGEAGSSASGPGKPAPID